MRVRSKNYSSRGARDDAARGVPSADTPTLANDLRIGGAANGLSGGAVFEQVLGRDSDGRAAGQPRHQVRRLVGSASSAGSAASCSDIYERFADPEVANNLCEKRLPTMC